MHEIRYTLSFRQRWQLLALAAAFGVVLVLEITLTGSRAVFLAVPMVAMLLNFFLFARFSTTLTPRGIAWRRYGTRSLAWDEIVHVRERRVLGTRQVQLLLGDGKVKNLAVPVSGWAQRDPEFDTKLATIWNAWVGATGNGPFMAIPPVAGPWQGQGQAPAPGQPLPPSAPPAP
ncbi:hypothetical protein [Embleya sp. NBC_00896]|uniref:hypothetical protein n=1 Tax=Embleya sp. NBC_00896 TaxID=2975961 RepID=UPI00386CD778|nr:hypothetical protein OG928_12655 [Embleya sp. NBC_00896]